MQKKRCCRLSTTPSMCGQASKHPPDVDPEGCDHEEVPLLRAEAGQLALRLRVPRQREQLLDHQCLWGKRERNKMRGVLGKLKELQTEGQMPSERRILIGGLEQL